ncbi:MAG: hypothetical protein GY765_09035 [bacterium]|nr:hypothetical protein [bacterium]
MALPVFSITIKEIKNPKANMIEKDYVELHETGVLSEDLGNDRFLFHPFSFAGGVDGHIYIYDILQAKILELDENQKLVRTLGRLGTGPGEFSGTGNMHPVQLKRGTDGRLYANDLKARKIVVFGTNGKHIKDIPYMEIEVKKPIVDEANNIYFITADAKDIVRLENTGGTCDVAIGPMSDTTSYLYNIPPYLTNRKESKKLHRDTVLQMIQLESTPGSEQLAYYPSSSTLYVIKDGKLVRKTDLLPKTALAAHKRKLEDLQARYKDAYRHMFFNFIVDRDEKDIFYLQFGRDEEKGTNTLYKFNTAGKLLKVLYFKYDKSSPFTLFRLKHNGRFLAVRDDKVVFFK